MLPQHTDCLENQNAAHDHKQKTGDKAYPQFRFSATGCHFCIACKKRKRSPDGAEKEMKTRKQGKRGVNRQPKTHPYKVRAHQAEKVGEQQRKRGKRNKHVHRIPQQLTMIRRTIYLQEIENAHKHVDRKKQEDIPYRTTKTPDERQDSHVQHDRCNEYQMKYKRQTVLHKKKSM